MTVDPILIQYQKILQLVTAHPEDARLWYDLGSTLNDMSCWGAAAGAFAQANNRHPNNVAAMANLGWEMYLTGREAEAREWLERAISINPYEPRPHLQMSQVLRVLGESELGLEHALRSVQLQPEVPMNHLVLAFAFGELGRWADCWREYHERIPYKFEEFQDVDKLFPRWTGQKTGYVFIQAEQGLGDTIFGLRWIPKAAERVTHITLDVHPELYHLIEENVPDNVTVRPSGGNPYPYPLDAWMPMMSLPNVLDDPQPEWKRYIGNRVPKAAFVDWGDGEVWNLNPPRNIGISWSGNPKHECSHNRDCDLAYWLPLLEIPNVQFHSLQVGEQSERMNKLGAFALIKKRDPEITNFTDTANILRELDLVITVDTSLAHLAGAMGCPVWMLVNRRGMDFRWGGTGETTPWYPSMRLFRRGLDDREWINTMKRVDHALRELVE